MCLDLKKDKADIAYAILFLLFAVHLGIQFCPRTQLTIAVKLYTISQPQIHL